MIHLDAALERLGQAQPTPAPWEQATGDQSDSEMQVQLQGYPWDWFATLNQQGKNSAAYTQILQQMEAASTQMSGIQPGNQPYQLSIAIQRLLATRGRSATREQLAAALMVVWLSFKRMGYG